ncbi:MAG: molecular chaperone TorD family protein, partial [bacterium]
METSGSAVGEAVRLDELARLRQGAYRLFGALLLNPDAEWIATLPRVAEEMLPESRPFDQFPFWGEWEGLLAELAGLGEPERAALEDVYVNQFMISSGPGKSPPYESSYVARESIPDLMADLEGEYARSGFQLSPSRGETSDHGAVELE